MSKEIDLTGRKFGYLTVIKKSGHHLRKSGRKDVLWECQCDCGSITNVSKSNLLNGGTTSCGCVQKQNRYKPHRSNIIKHYGDYCSIELYDKSVALFDIEDLDKICDVRWHLNASGYACNSKGVPMHKTITECLDCSEVIHHKNKNKLDNRKSNLVKMSRKAHTKLHDNLNLTKDEAERALAERSGE